MTTRGFREAEAEQTAHLIADVLEAPQDEGVITGVREQVSRLTRDFPVYR
jgi:glycine hydroxymethyltransferase